MSKKYEIGSKWYLKQKGFIKEYLDNEMIELNLKFNKIFELTFFDDTSIFLSNEFVDIKISKEAFLTLFVSMDSE